MHILQTTGHLGGLGMQFLQSLGHGALDPGVVSVIVVVEVVVSIEVVVTVEWTVVAVEISVVTVDVSVDVPLYELVVSV